MAERKCATAPVVAYRTELFCAFLAAVMLLIGIVANAVFLPSSAEAKTYPAAEKKIEAAVSKGCAWVDLGSTRIPWPEAYKALKKVTYKKASYIVKVDSSQTWRMGGSKYAYGMKIKYRSAKQRKALNSKVRSMLKKVSRYDSQSEKVEKIHDAISKRCSYDYVSYRSGRLRADSGNAYGSLVRGRSVCAGYAEAFQLIALKAGLKSRYVCNGNHAWNLVRVSGKWYHIDVCWDDTSGSKRKYFLKGSATMAKYKYHSVKECYPSKVSISKKDYVEPSPPVEEITIDEPAKVEDPAKVDDSAKTDNGPSLGAAIRLKDPSQGVAAAPNDVSGPGVYTGDGNASVGGGRQV